MKTRKIQIPVCGQALLDDLQTMALYFDEGYFGERRLRFWLNQGPQSVKLMRMADNPQGLAPGYIPRFAFVFKQGLTVLEQVDSNDGSVAVDGQLLRLLLESPHTFVEIEEPAPEPVPQ